jgi:hypothetical protein
MGRMPTMRRRADDPDPELDVRGEALAAAPGYPSTGATSLIIGPVAATAVRIVYLSHHDDRVSASLGFADRSA